MRDYAYHDRQTFLQACGRRWDDTTVGRALTALGGAVLAILLVAGAQA